MLLLQLCQTFFRESMTMRLGGLFFKACKFGKGKTEGEGRAAVYFTFYVDFTAVHFYDKLDDGKTQAGAAGTSAARLVHPVEAVEDEGKILGGDAKTGIFNRNERVLIIRPASERNLSAVGCIFNTVFNKVEQDLLKPVAVGHSGNLLTIGFNGQCDFFAICLGSQFLSDLFKKRFDRCAFKSELLPVFFGVELGQLQKVFN